MLHGFLKNLEAECEVCGGKGQVEKYSPAFLEHVHELELRFPTYEQALTIARDKYKEEISYEICPSCNGQKVTLNENGKILMSHKEQILQFFEKYK
jgi:RecJ-like exonuclease